MSKNHHFSPVRTTYTQIILVIITLIITIYLLVPVVIPSVNNSQSIWGKIFPNNNVSLGLDLKGGVSILLKVDSEQYYKEYTQNVAESISQSVRETGIKFNLSTAENSKIKFSVDSSDNSRELSYTSLAQDKGKENKEKLENIYKTLNKKLSSNEYSITQEKDEVIVGLTAKFRQHSMERLLNQSMEIVRHRIDESGTKEIDVQRQGEDMILIQIPGVYNTNEVKSLLGKTAKMTFHLLDNNVNLEQVKSGRIPFGVRMIPMEEKDDEELDNDDKNQGKDQYSSLEKKKNRIRRELPVIIRPMMQGEELIDAQAIVGDTGEYIVRFMLSDKGAKNFANITTTYKGRNLAVVLDNTVISAPRISEPILGGSGIISGNFTAESAREMALLLRSGALPTALTVIEERNVGPTLGQESIQAGCKAIIIGLIAVVIMMLYRYRYWGLLANLALIFNLALIIAVMTTINATLTLPGLSGIALTLGMAVDANVLIFERIREEIKRSQIKISTDKNLLCRQIDNKGDVEQSLKIIKPSDNKKNKQLATLSLNQLSHCIESGYGTSFSTILDSNITTISAAIVLYAFGTASVRGFAVTLTIGIISSMFTSVTFTKVILAGYFKLRNKYQKIKI